MDILFKDLRSPTRFEKSPNNIWSTPQLNEFILRSHLNDNIYGGSYDKAHQEKIIEFITKKAPNKKFHKLLDVGCGPGLYTGEFYKHGYDVTGIDLSQNSIEYAKNNAVEENLDIDYSCNDILEFQTDKKFNIILMIYDILCNFNYEERQALLNKILNILDTDGLFIFEVPTKFKFNSILDFNHWNYFPEDNEYMREDFLYLFSMKKYDDDLLLNYSTYIFSDEEHITVYDWIQHFTVEKIKMELNQAGFTILDIYGDASGKIYEEEGHRMAIFCQK